MAYKGGKREKASLKYNKDIYTPEGAKTLSDKELKKEYTRLRSIARKRLQRFEGTEWTDTQAYKLNADIYKPIKEIKSNRELRHLFSDVAKFITSKSGSVSGLTKQREEAINTLHDRGYDFVTKQNFKQFAEFMEYARVSNINRMYDSKRLAEFYEAAEKKKISGAELQKTFRKWTKKQKQEKKIQNINPRNSMLYRNDLEGLSNKELENRIIHSMADQTKMAIKREQKEKKGGKK